MIPLQLLLTVALLCVCAQIHDTWCELGTARLLLALTPLACHRGCSLHILISLALLLNLLGLASLVGVALMIGSLTITGVLSKRMARMQELAYLAGDNRIRLTNEMLSGIKLIKAIRSQHLACRMC